MEEYRNNAYADDGQQTIQRRYLHPGEAAPDFRLDFLDLADQMIRTVSLADSAGMVRLLNIVNTLDNLLCQQVTQRWEALSVALPGNACIYTVSMDPPQRQARWQDAVGVLHQALSTSRSAQFGQDYGVWIEQWQQLERAIFVLDSTDRIVYAEYLADQQSEPDYESAMEALQRAALA